ncbi:hypothetical protein tb265_50020 [Gemmatimonadetes bacterium T265]|nr:hypothetical protein tb265_50020 [Gemmatimonadetes bacterium T265]
MLAGVSGAGFAAAPARLAAQALPDPFAGIVLSDSQTVALQALITRTGAAASPFIARLLRLTSADTALARATRDSLVALYTAHNTTLRQALTPDQQVTFDANMQAFAAAHRAAALARDKQLMGAPPSTTPSATSGGQP